MQDTADFPDFSELVGASDDAPATHGGSLSDRVRQMAVAGVTDIVAQAVGRVSEDLAELAIRTFESSRQRALAAAASVLSMHGKSLPAAFESAYAVRYAASLAPGRAPEPGIRERQTSLDELSLVDEDVMTDRVCLSRLVHRTRGHLDSDDLLGLPARYGAMLGREPLSDSEQPLAPEVIYDALNAVIDERADSDDARLTLLEGFEPYLSANLGGLYGRLNALFRENGVLPQIKRRVQRTSAGRRGVAPQAVAGETHERETGDGEMFELPPPGPDRDAVLGILARRVAEGTVDARRSAVRMLRDDSLVSGAGAVPGAAEALIESLSRMQSGVGHGLPEGRPSERIRALTSVGDGQTGALDQLTVEIVSLIFDYLYHDARLAAPVKQELLRLQVVAVKAALLDRSFFASKSHPMRALIDRTTQISCDPDTNAEADSSFVEGLRGIIDGILHDFDRDLGVFQQAIDALEALALQEQQRRDEQLREFTERAEREESDRLAREEAAREISDVINDLTPGFVRTFLLERWARVLAAARLQGPPGESERLAGLEHARTLAWSVEPKRASDIPRMAASLPTLVRELMKGMDAVGVAREDVDDFFNELMSWHTKMIDQAKHERRSGSAASESAEAGARGGSSTQPGSNPGAVANDAGSAASPMQPAPRETLTTANSDPEAQALLAELKRGQIVEVRQKNKTPMRVKIAWVSPGRTLFALSRFPDFARSLSRDQMLASMRSGRLVIVDNEGAVEKAIRTVESTGDIFAQTTIIDTELGGNTLVMETGIHVPV